MVHIHGDGFLHRSFTQYALAVRCGWCGAEPGAECSVRKGGRRFHLRREDAGTRWMRRDIDATPWLEDRTPGACYSTLPGCE